MERFYVKMLVLIYMFVFLSGISSITVSYILTKQSSDVSYKKMFIFLTVFFLQMVMSFSEFYKEFFLGFFESDFFLSVLFDISLNIFIYYWLYMLIDSIQDNMKRWRKYLLVGCGIYLLICLGLNSVYYTDVFAGAAGMIDTLLVAANFLFLFIVLGVHIFYWLKIKKVAVITFQQKLFTISIPILLYILWYMAENAFYIISSYPFGKLLWPCEPGMVFFLFVNLYIESNLIRKELVDNGTGKPNPDEAGYTEDELPTIESLSSIYFLTEREREIFQQLALGHGNAEIADDLNISIYTVKRHLNNIFKKTNVKSRFELINMLMKH